MISVRSSGGGGKIKIPVSFAVFQPPNKTNYTAGEQLSLTGMKVMVTYSDDTMEDVTADCVFNPAPGTVLYEQNTKVSIAWTWENQIDYSCEQAITVSRVLQSIAISTLPSKTTYNKNEALSLAGMVVKATFTSGATANVAGYTSSPAAGATLGTLGNQTVTVSYTEGGITKTATFTVTVNVKVVTWAGGTDQEIADMVAAADAGLLNLRDYWAVGQERTVQLSAMPATGVGETHAAQTVTLVLLHASGMTLDNGKPCNFIVGQKDCLNEKGYMNSTDTNSGSWEGSKRRAWCNSVYRNAIPAVLRGIFKVANVITATTYNGTGLTTSKDYFFLPAAKEIFGGTATSAGSGSGYSNITEYKALFQFDYFKTAANRIKKVNGSAGYWWERSPYYNFSSSFCDVNSDGTADYISASNTDGLAPCGCI